MRRTSLPWLTIVALTAGLAALSCGGGGGGSSHLDRTFGNGGKVITAIGTALDEAFALAIQSDGKLVAAGTSNTGTQNEFALVRYNPDGSLDATFNGTGIVTTAIGSSTDQAYALAIQADGKLVAAGYSYNGTQNVFALVRYNPDGSLDATFNGMGIVTTAIDTIADLAFALAIQPDGKLVVAGFSYSSADAQYEFAMVRYNPDGSLDVTFNGTGMVTTAVGSIADQAFALAIQADGKLVVAGYSDNGTQNLFALVRYNTDGSLDATFNGTGIVTTAIGTIADLASALVIQPDGRLVAAGLSITTGTRNEFALVRYNADGSLDTTFNATGMVTTAIGGKGDQANALAIQPDGKLVAAGSSYAGTQNRFALARYNPDGSRDATFNGSGKVTTPIGNKGASASAVAIQADGKLVAAGYAFDKDYQADFALARYMP